MKVSIGGYKNWFGPYQLAYAICFWAKNKSNTDPKYPEWVDNFAGWLAHGKHAKKIDDDSDIRFDNGEYNTLLYKLLLWINSKKKRKVKIRIDKWDTWNMDHTLALIILPMLKQLKETKHGYQMVDIEDVPHHLQVTEREEHASQLNLFDLPIVNDSKSVAEMRWDYVLDEIIYAFEMLNKDNWEEQFYTGNVDLIWVKNDNPDMPGTSTMKEGPNHTRVFDKEGYCRVDERISNGLKLFGKYYRGLWD